MKFHWCAHVMCTCIVCVGAFLQAYVVMNKSESYAIWRVSGIQDYNYQPYIPPLKYAIFPGPNHTGKVAIAVSLDEHPFTCGISIKEGNQQRGGSSYSFWTHTWCTELEHVWLITKHSDQGCGQGCLELRHRLGMILWAYSTSPWTWNQLLL